MSVRVRMIDAGVLLALSLLISPAARAQVCAVTSPPNVNFGSVGVQLLNQVPVDTTATFTVNCTLGLPNNNVVLCLDIGFGTGGVSETDRRMLSGADALSYQLYSDTCGGTIWGSFVFPPNPPLPPVRILTLNVLGSGTFTLSPPLCARLFGGQSTAPPGSYLSTFSSVQAQLRFRHCGGLLQPPCDTCEFAQLLPPSTSFTVSATVDNTCLVSATLLDFGSQGLLNANVDATNAITVRCTSGTPWAASLNAGSGTGGTVNLRKMTGPGGATVAYTIYRDSARTEVWGDGTSGTLTVSGTGTGGDQPQTGYGRVNAQATPAPGLYSDTIVVTVTH
jgi:spore coat protein U-like protein